LGVARLPHRGPLRAGMLFDNVHFNRGLRGAHPLGCLPLLGREGGGVTIVNRKILMHQAWFYLGATPVKRIRIAQPFFVFEKKFRENLPFRGIKSRAPFFAAGSPAGQPVTVPSTTGRKPETCDVHRCRCFLSLTIMVFSGALFPTFKNQDILSSPASRIFMRNDNFSRFQPENVPVS
jgi:hypothetical protein